VFVLSQKADSFCGLAADPEEHRFHIPPGAFWDDVRSHSTNIGERLNIAFRAIEDAIRACGTCFRIWIFLLRVYRLLVLSLIAFILAHWAYLSTNPLQLPDWGGFSIAGIANSVT
jgi:hypothetical protein